ncbi:MAG TPA: serine/threonine protein kinase [Steroidobacteraceae bacterium]|nr:serine/threonine protein kinase [Steroidobacteraceae bacterium]
MIAKSQPFSGLGPDVVLDAAASVGFEGGGRLFALNSYENRVYRLGAGGDALVLKFYRPERWTDAQIGEEHEFALELAAAELPVAAPLVIAGSTLFRFREYRFAAFPCLPGRAPELDAPGARVLLGRALARIHAIGATRTFRFRPRIGIERLGLQAREQVLTSELLPPALATSYAAAADALLERVRRAFVNAGPVHDLRIHGDCHPGNLLWNPQGPVFVDLDDCGSGPRIQDLWMLLSGDGAEQQRQWNELLEGYSQFGEIDMRELTLVEPLRALRMLHHAAWVVQRWEDPAFPRAFPWFGEPRFWERHVGDLLEQVGAIDDPPLLQR